MKNQYQHVSHTFEPLYDEQSEILILGSFPSVKSREQGFYYGHPRNRFWKVLSDLCQCQVPESIEEKIQMLKEHHIAIWDVVDSCDIIGSSDSSIKNVVPADIASICRTSKIQQIYANGRLAQKLYSIYIEESLGMPVIPLPSTSPANAAYSLERLSSIWKETIGKI